jgi:hypothetical protein
MFTFKNPLLLVLVTSLSSLYAQPVTWDNSTSYSTGALVVVGTSTYIATQSVEAGISPTSTTFWTDLSVAATTLNVPVEEVPFINIAAILNSIPDAAPGSVSTSSVNTVNSISGNELLIENKSTGERAVWELQNKYRQFLTLDNVLTGGVSINQFSTTEKIVASGDFDRDGNFDIVSDDSLSGVKTIKFLSNNVVSSSLNILTTTVTTKIVGAADFNNDSIIDLVTDDSSSGVKTIHYLSGSGTNLSISDSLLIVTDSSYRIAGVTDIDGDGKPDFITEQKTSNTDPLFKVARQIWYTNGTSITSRTTWLTFDQEWTIINVGDFDIDGTPDLMVEQYTTGRKGIWYMQSNGIREGFEYVTLEEKWKSSCSGDFNKDGSTDALFQDNTTGNIIILHLGNQDGSGNSGGAKYTVQLLNLNFVPAGNSIATVDWTMKGFVDHDSNGQSSILAQNTTTGDIALWDLNSGSLSSTTFKNASINLRIVGTGQFSGDSTPDIILENTSNGQKICWVMSSSGGSYTVSSEEIILTDTGSRIAGIGDFNADSELDLIVEQVTSNTSPVFKTYRNIWFMNGTSRVSTKQFLYFDQEWEIKGTKDFDGNGTPDMIVEQKNVGRRGVWYMVGQELVEGFIYCTVDPSWQFAN